MFIKVRRVCSILSQLDLIPANITKTRPDWDGTERIELLSLPSNRRKKRGKKLKVELNPTPSLTSSHFNIEGFY